MRSFDAICPCAVYTERLASDAKGMCSRIAQRKYAAYHVDMALAGLVATVAAPASEPANDR